MSQFACSRFAICTLFLLASWTSVARSDNGTVVSGTVIAIDVANQIMRVYVTAVDGQTLVGGPDTNYVDYLVSPNTAVLNYNNQIVSQSNVQVGSRIQMQFLGAYASRILLLSGYSNGNLVTYNSSVPSYQSGYVQNYSTVQNYSSYRQPYLITTPVRHVTNSFPVLNVNHLHLQNNTSTHSPSHAHIHSQSPSHVGTAHNNHLHAR